jgi:hypothetical protein
MPNQTSQANAPTQNKKVTLRFRMEGGGSATTVMASLAASRSVRFTALHTASE